MYYVVVDYADTRFSSEYIRENEKVREKYVFACSYGAQVEFFKQKNDRKSRDTLPLNKVTYWSRNFTVQYCTIRLQSPQKWTLKWAFFMGSSWLSSRLLDF